MAEYVWDNPKTSFCALRYDKVYRHFFGGGETVNVIIYYVMLEFLLMTLLLYSKQTFFPNMEEHHISTI
jgi:hypothetical protein